MDQAYRTEQFRRDESAARQERNPPHSLPLPHLPKGRDCRLVKIDSTTEDGKYVVTELRWDAATWPGAAIKYTAVTSAREGWFQREARASNVGIYGAPGDLCYAIEMPVFDGKSDLQLELPAVAVARVVSSTPIGGHPKQHTYTIAFQKKNAQGYNAAWSDIGTTTTAFALFEKAENAALPIANGELVSVIEKWLYASGDPIREYWIIGEVSAGAIQSGTYQGRVGDNSIKVRPSGGNVDGSDDINIFYRQPLPPNAGHGLPVLPPILSSYTIGDAVYYFLFNDQAEEYRLGGGIAVSGIMANTDSTDLLFGIATADFVAGPGNQLISLTPCDGAGEYNRASPPASVQAYLQYDGYTPTPGTKIAAGTIIPFMQTQEGNIALGHVRQIVTNVRVVKTGFADPVYKFQVKHCDDFGAFKSTETEWQDFWDLSAGINNGDLLIWDTTANKYVRLEAPGDTKNYALGYMGGVVQWIEMVPFRCPPT